MIFKQTIVNATLSVVCVLGWGSCASAMYDPYIGRFASRDPIGFEGSDCNFYCYVTNQPLGSIDPSGTQSGIPTMPFGPSGSPRIIPTGPFVPQFVDQFDRCMDACKENHQRLCILRGQLACVIFAIRVGRCLPRFDGDEEGTRGANPTPYLLDYCLRAWKNACANDFDSCVWSCKVRWGRIVPATLPKAEPVFPEIVPMM